MCFGNEFTSNAIYAWADAARVAICSRVGPAGET